MPAGLKLPQGKFVLNYSDHALQEKKKDKFGEISLPEMLDTEKAEVVEVELDKLGVSKIVYRAPMDNYRDISLAIIPGKKTMFVKTVWSNIWNDRHKTLNTSRYAKP